MLRNKVKILTKDIHKYVETLPLMQLVTDRTVSPQIYYNYLSQLKSIYRTIEDHDFFSKTFDFRLHERCQKDCQEIAKQHNLQEIEPSKITDIYTNYLKDSNNADVLIGHIYVRYMADLMGGKIIQKRIRDIFPTNVYDLEMKHAQPIITYVNTQVENDQVFISEVNHAFAIYAHIFDVVLKN